MFSTGHARPPAQLVGLIAGITLVPLVTLLWLGWRLLEQDRLLERQQSQDRVERAADLVVAALQRAITDSEQRLAAGADSWPAGAVVVTFQNDRVDVAPPGRVPYLPVAPPLREAPASAFVDAEAFEFRDQNHAAAIGVLQRLSASTDPAIRAGAGLRLARNLQRVGRSNDALRTYATLVDTDSVGAGGVPVALAARYAQCKLLDQLGRPVDLKAQAQQLAADLRIGRWAVTGPVHWLYAADAARWSGVAVTAGEGQDLAKATAALWERATSTSAAAVSAGRETLEVEGQTFAVLWHASNGVRRALVATPAFVKSQWLAAAAPVVEAQRVSLTLGTRAAAGVPSASRSTGDSTLPWTITVTSVNPGAENSAFATRRRLLIAGFLLLVSMALVASYLIVRAVSRELAVARLQSDFVAAVSHEFRTPLTSLRQFTDMLREHAALDDDRRRLAYDAQSCATERLTRLVESLLDFGRMEAGARRYTLERGDCTALVQRVVEDFRSEARAGGYEVVFHGNGAAAVDVDAEALSRAVWNLLDNAVKYSPDQQSVEVGLSRQNGTVRIMVRDRGMGIPLHEQRGIFAKFQRGEQARTHGIKGTGIGLAMVDEIVRAHAGRVEVESAPDHGSTFTIVLPAKE